MKRSLGHTYPSGAGAAAVDASGTLDDLLQKYGLSKEEYLKEGTSPKGRDISCSASAPEEDEDLVSIPLNPCEAVPNLYVEATDADSLHVCWSFWRGHLEPAALGWEVELWAYDFHDLTFDDEGLFDTMPQLQRLGAAMLAAGSRDTTLHDLRPKRRYKVRVRALLPEGLGPIVGPWSDFVTADTRGYGEPGNVSKGSQRFWHTWANSRRGPIDARDRIM